MREHFYTLILRNKGKEVLSFDFGKDRDTGLSMFYDLLEVVKKKADLILYEDKDTSRERVYVANKEGL